MAETQIGSILDDDLGIFKYHAIANDSTVNLADREDEKTVRKTQLVSDSIPKKMLTNTTLIGREITEGEVQDPPLIDQLKEIDHEHFVAVEKALTEPTSFEPNYIIRVQNLVGQILVQLNRIAEKDRVQIEGMKSKYQRSTQQVANSLRALGSHGLQFSMLVFGASFLQFLSPYQSDRKIANIFAKEVCPKLGNLFGGATIQINKYQAESIANLVLQEYSAKTQKGGSDANTKQEITSILDKILESLKRAAQAG